jgi:hypothetical protein
MELPAQLPHSIVPSAKPIVKESHRFSSGQQKRHEVKRTLSRAAAHRHHVHLNVVTESSVSQLQTPKEGLSDRLQ